MQRDLAIVLIMGSLRAAPAVASQNDSDVQRQAALDQVAWVAKAYAERLRPRGAEWPERSAARFLILIAPDVFKAASADGRVTSLERALALAFGAP